MFQVVSHCVLTKRLSQCKGYELQRDEVHQEHVGRHLGIQQIAESRQRVVDHLKLDQFLLRLLLLFLGLLVHFAHLLLAGHISVAELGSDRQIVAGLVDDGVFVLFLLDGWIESIQTGGLGSSLVREGKLEEGDYDGSNGILLHMLSKSWPQ